MKTVHALLLAATLAATPALADPPIDIWCGFRKPLLSCQNIADLKKIVEVMRTKSVGEIKAIYDSYNAQTVGKLPRCNLSYFPGIQIGKDFEDAGEIPNPRNNGYVHGWLLHGGTSDFEGYLLYTEDVVDKGA